MRRKLRGSRLLSENVCAFCLRISDLGVAAEAAIELSGREYAALRRVVCLVRDSLVERPQADGSTIGANVGPARGQTVMRAHVHVIPRLTGNVADPRAGLRLAGQPSDPYRFAVD